MLLYRYRVDVVSSLRSAFKVRRQYYSRNCNNSLYILIYQQNGDILPILCISVKGLFDRRGLCLRVDNEEVLLCVWRLGDMLMRKSVNLFLPEVGLTNSNASK